MNNKILEIVSQLKGSLLGVGITNTNILDAVIKEAKNLGYEFKSLDEFE